MYACAHWAALHYNAPVLLLTEVLRMGTHGTEELPALLDGNPVTCVTDGCPTCLEGIPCLERNCLERNCLEGIPTCLEGTQPAYFAQTAGLCTLAVQVQHMLKALLRCEGVLALRLLQKGPDTVVACWLLSCELLHAPS